MNENNQCSGGVCSSEKGGQGAMCGCGCKQGGHRHLLKWLLKIVVLVIVFCFAFQMGEMKAMLNSYNHMRQEGYSRGGMMMDNSGWNGGIAQPMSGASSSSSTQAPAATQ